MNFSRLIELRGRIALWLAEKASAWATRLRALAARDVAGALRPDDLLNRDQREDR
ncbi:MAG: hypothetical protein FD144_4788 [Rhodospirillaceae bacterium]|nr:MAG: hypothetical protein FD144_4788 [Rhodospirillaceae bacterium]